MTKRSAGQGASKQAPAAQSTTDGAETASSPTGSGNPAQREEVLKVVVLLVQTLSSSLGLSKEQACRTIRWAAHVIEGSKEEL